MACGNDCSCNSQDSRRDFLKSSVASIATGLLAIYVDETHVKVHTHLKTITNEEARVGIPGKKFVIVMDLAKCDGCGKCTEACNKMHYPPKTKEWIEVLEMQDSPKTAPYYMPKNCFHCEEPDCLTCTCVNGPCSQMANIKRYYPLCSSEIDLYLHYSNVKDWNN